jgi:SAM-dependent methyltransferase
MRYLKILYRFYPGSKLLAEYRHGLNLAKKYGCRRILDVGCGTGGFAKLLLEHNLVDFYVGVDVNDIFRINDPRALFIVADGRNPPLSGFFDCVFFINSIFYIGVNHLDTYAKYAKYVVIIDIDPKYPHVRLADRLERWRGMRMERADLIEMLEKKYCVCETGGMVTYYVVLRP